MFDRTVVVRGVDGRVDDDVGSVRDEVTPVHVALSDVGLLDVVSRDDAVERRTGAREESASVADALVAIADGKVVQAGTEGDDVDR